MPLPPSRRDNAGPPPANPADLAFAARHHRTALRSMDPGFLDGRLATPQPVEPGPSLLVGGDDGSGEEGPSYEWEDGDRHQIRATGTQSARLSHVPIEESLFVRWHPDDRGGVPLPNELWTLTDQTVTIPDPGVFAVRDTFSFQYQYEPEEGIVEPELIGYTTITGNHTSIALPAGTEAGDLLVLALCGRDIATCSDSRMTSSYVAGTGNGGVWAGIEDGSGAALTIVLDSTASAGGNDGTGVLAVFRGDPVDITSNANSTGTTAPFNPTTPSGSTFGIAALFMFSGLISGAVTGEFTGAWTEVHREGGFGAGKCSVWIGYNATGTPTGQWDTTGGISSWFARIIGVQ